MKRSSQDGTAAGSLTAVVSNPLTLQRPGAQGSAKRVPALQRYFELSLYCLVTTSVLAVISTGKLDIFSTLAAPVVLILKGIRLWRGRGAEISHRTATWLVLAYFLFFPLDLWVFSRSLSSNAPNPAMYAGLMAAIHLMLFAVIVRLYSARTNRDYLFLAVLAFTGMLASAILTVDTAFLVSLALFLVVAVSTFVGLEIRRGADGALTPPMDWGTRPAQQLQRALALTSVLVALGALVMGAGLFFVIPRFTAGYWSALNLQPTLMTGFSEDVALGTIGRIKRNNTVVMRIRVDGDPRRAAQVHWRGVALTNFDGRRWFTPSTGSTLISPSADGVYRLAQPPLPFSEELRLHYTVMLEPVATDAVFLAQRPTDLRGHFSPSEVRIGEPLREYLLLDDTDSVINPFHNPSKMRYEASSLLPEVPPYQLRAATTNYPAGVRSVYLQLPVIDPRIPRLAARITAGAVTPYDKAARIETYLQSHFGYTLDFSTAPRSEDPLAYFLFVKKAGYCEYFASAMVVMLRTLGIPARYVNGFRAGEYNDVGEDYVVRASNAHSWVEVYFPGYDWITFDPTPLGPSEPRGFMARAGMYWDWFQLTWSDWVINYDFTHQLRLAQNLQRSSREWSAHFRRYSRAKRDLAVELMLRLDQRARSSPHFLPALLALLVLALVGKRNRAIVAYVAQQWQLRAHRRGNLPPALAALEYQRMLRMLARRGWRKAPWQTPLEFAASIGAASLATPVSQVTEIYQAARFGAHPANAQRMSALLESVQAHARTLQKLAKPE